LLERGKKLAMADHANAAPPGTTNHPDKSILKSKYAAFRRSKKVKVSFSPEGKPRFYKFIER
jgi:hypothetical protein